MSDWERKPFESSIKLTVEINDFETLALLVEFLKTYNFRVRSKEDQTLVRVESALGTPAPKEEK